MTNQRKILLTGATGFVGGELLARLLARDDRNLICLVRANDDAEASRRGEETLVRLVGSRDVSAASRRIEWLPGDVELADLALSRDRRRRLAAEIQEIYHCAASTRFDLKLAEVDRINVAGVVAVHDLAAEAVVGGTFRRLHHVSTAFAVGRRHGLTLAEHLPEDHERRFRNTYERTKARAERFLRRARRVPTTVYRPSIIVGDSRDGYTRSWNVVYFPMKLMTAGHLPFGPAGKAALLDCVPVDFVADGILALGRREDGVGRTFHLTAGTRALTVREVVAHTYEAIARHTGESLHVGTRIVGRLRWLAIERALRVLAGARGRDLIARFRPYVPYTRVTTVFDNRRETALLAAAGVRNPDPADFFPRIVKYALVHDFGRRRSPDWEAQRPVEAAHSVVRSEGCTP